MGCSQSTVATKPEKKEPPKKGPKGHRIGLKPLESDEVGVLEPEEINVKLEELRSTIQIGTRSESEIAPPQQQKDFDSWKHKVDSTDIQALKEGHALPMNQSAHHHLVKKTHKSLVELVEDPSSLKRAVKMRRMELEEVTDYKAALSLNGIPENEKSNEKSKSNPKAPPLPGIHGL